MSFTIFIDHRALQDIREAIDFYNDRMTGLGEQFEASLFKQLFLLENTPFLRIRYDEVRCLPLKKYPYMVHFSVDEEKGQVSIWAVIHTSQDPEKWQERGDQ